MPGIASRPSDEQDKTARAVSSDGSLPVTMDRDLVSASSAIERLDGFDAAQWEVVQQLRAGGAKVGVLVCKVMEGSGSYWRLGAMSAAPEIGVREGDDVWAWDGTRDVNRRFAQLQGSPGATALTRGECRTLAVRRVLWRDHILIVGR